jgi:hypothetical protein
MALTAGRKAAAPSGAPSRHRRRQAACASSSSSAFTPRPSFDASPPLRSPTASALLDTLPRRQHTAYLDSHQPQPRQSPRLRPPQGPPRSLLTSAQARRPRRTARLHCNHSRAPRKRPGAKRCGNPLITLDLCATIKEAILPTATTPGAILIVAALTQIVPLRILRVIMTGRSRLPIAPCRAARHRPRTGFALRSG